MGKNGSVFEQNQKNDIGDSAVKEVKNKHMEVKTWYMDRTI